MTHLAIASTIVALALAYRNWWLSRMVKWRGHVIKVQARELAESALTDEQKACPEISAMLDEIIEEPTETWGARKRYAIAAKMERDNE